MRTLARWLIDQRPAQPLCSRGGDLVSSDAFVGDVAALAELIEQHGSGRWILCTESAYACAVGLLALWQSGSIAVLPPNLEAGSLRELTGGARGLLTDRVVPNIGLETLTLLGASSAPERKWRALDPAGLAIELCTSGSTGARKVVPKTLLQLEAEIEALEGEFGAACRDARSIGTVSFQHIYGLLFRVLWPLCAGRVFLEAATVDPADIARQMEKKSRAVLISSPAHLKRLPELLELARLRAQCVEVFSSGGALDAATALCFEQRLGYAPVEVLGSTETGGIAWRRQTIGTAGDWTAFRGVQVEARDGLLHVHSAPAGGSGGVTTGDACRIVGAGHFELLGRADRIIKLFDERVSLVELELRLCAHALVNSAAALMLERSGTPRIAAVVVLTRTGESLLGEQGKSALIAALRTHLRDFFRATALPRTWRFVERLPEDAQGKTSVQSLAALFAESSLIRVATLVERKAANEREFELKLAVPADLCFLRGHFENMPVVPGVVQLQWVLEWAAEWLGETPRVRGVEALKFKQILAGGTRFRLRLERTNDLRKLRFKLWNERGEFSSGRVLVELGGA